MFHSHTIQNLLEHAFPKVFILLLILRNLIGQSSLTRGHVDTCTADVTSCGHVATHWCAACWLELSTNLHEVSPTRIYLNDEQIFSLTSVIYGHCETSGRFVGSSTAGAAADGAGQPRHQHHGGGRQPGEAAAQALPPLAAAVRGGPGRGGSQQHRLLHVRQRETEHGKLSQRFDMVQYGTLGTHINYNTLIEK